MFTLVRWVLLASLWTSSLVAVVRADGQTPSTCLEQGEDGVPSRKVPLPGKLTIKPDASDWRIEFILEDEKNGTRECVSLQETMEKIQLSLFKGECEEQNIVDFQLWPLHIVKRSQWTLLNVTVDDKTLFLTTSHGEAQKLVMRETPLPMGHFAVSYVHGASFALGCQVNCPSEIGSKNRGPGILSTIKRIGRPYLHFFMKPGEGFTRLNLELECETILGHEVTVGETNLSSEELSGLVPLEMWHKIFLEYDAGDGIYNILVDYRLVRTVNSGVSYCYKFKNFLVRAEGETFVSFECDPTTGEHDASPAVCELQQSELGDNSKVVYTLIAVMATLVFVGLVLYFLGFDIKRGEHRCSFNVCRSPEKTESSTNPSV